MNKGPGDDPASMLCFFAFMRAGELSTLSSTSYDSNAHLCVQDVSVEYPQSPSVMQVLIKQSKTDPFRKGVTLAIGRTGTKLCPVSAMLDFIVARAQISFISLKCPIGPIHPRAVAEYAVLLGDAPDHHLHPLTQNA